MPNVQGLGVYDNEVEEQSRLPEESLTRPVSFAAKCDKDTWEWGLVMYVRLPQGLT
jgi:hypothetical protein